MSTLSIMSAAGSSPAASAVDDEVIRVFGQRNLAAAKKCICAECGRHIAAGETVQRRCALLADGEVGTWVTCVACIGA